jgi:hypothetical protein
MGLRTVTFFSAMVFTLNVATVVTFATLPCALQLFLQRITQVVTMVMISHMFLNLKGCDHHDSTGVESCSTRLSFRMQGPECSEIAILFEPRVTGADKISSTLVGNLGNDLRHTSILDSWTAK